MAARTEGAPLMTTMEVADALQVNRQTVGRWRRRGKLASTGGARTPRFFRAEIEAILNGHPLTAKQIAAVREQVLGGAQ